MQVKVFPGHCVRGNSKVEGCASLVARLWLSLLAQENTDVISAASLFQRIIVQKALQATAGESESFL